MGSGLLQVHVLTANNALPISDATVLIKNANGQIVYRLTTDKNGLTPKIALYAPDKTATQYPNAEPPYFGSYDVEIESNNYKRAYINGTQVYDTVTSILPVQMHPIIIGDSVMENTDIYNIPQDNGLNSEEPIR